MSEVTNLAVADLDLDVDVVQVLGKDRGVRSVPFGAKTGQALSRYVRTRARHPLALNSALWLGGRGWNLRCAGRTVVWLPIRLHCPSCAFCGPCAPEVGHTT